MLELVSKPGISATHIREIAYAAASIALTTVISLVVVPVTGYVTVALLYLLLVVFAGLNFTRWTVLLMAATCALLWNFLFIPPRYTFYIAKIEDLMHFAMFFVVAIAMGHLTSRLRANQILEAQREHRTRVLYELVWQAGLAMDLDSGLHAAVTLIETLFDSSAALLLRQNDHTLASKQHGAGSLHIDKSALQLARRVFTDRRPAGRFTVTMPDADALYLPLQARTAIMGVLIAKPSVHKIFDAAENELLETLGVLIGSILERDHLLAAFKHAEILKASERLHRALLQSVSHELKTPLAAARTGVDALASGVLVEDKKKLTMKEVQTALRRLQRVIDNLLNMSRIESGAIQPKVDWCEVGELIEAAIDLAGDSLREHRIVTDVEDTLPMVKIDQALLEQALCNLLLNAASWSPPGSEIRISARVENDSFLLSVEDQGVGISESEIDKIFEAFYRGTDARPGGAGLGLAIVEGFVHAHGGKVKAVNHQPCGAKFIATTPVETFKGELLEELA
jgi:two-component system, OmpR family, sensor histidine kinase KdpD